MFKFKKFTVYQDRCAMKVGTDGVLLGAWVEITSSDKYMLDIGSGTGLIALMLAQRSSEISAFPHIDSVEIDVSSAQQAIENIAISEWSQQIDIHSIDISDFNQNIKYDVIVSNPPYFVDSLHCPDASRTNARHTSSLSFKNLAESVVRLLDDKGRFSLILPYNESKLFDKEIDNMLYLHKRCNIRSRENQDIIRVMSEYRLKNCNNIKVDEISIREVGSNEYTGEYKSLTSDFYLKF